MALLEIKTFEDTISHFPAAWQAVIFRNYGKVSADIIADIIHTTPQIVEQNALLLGVSNIEYNPKWRQKGYITLIRENWHILDYEGLCTLTGFTLSELEDILYNEDFLYSKLGYFKPKSPDVRYYPLSAEQLKQTEQIRTQICDIDVAPLQKPFDFSSHFEPQTYQNSGITIKGAQGVLQDHVSFWLKYYDLSALDAREIQLCPQQGQQDESYRIEQKSGELRIIGGNEGILRGLQEIAENLHAHGTAVLQQTTQRKCVMGRRLISPYLGGTGDILTAQVDYYLPDGYLAQLAKLKVNGVFLTGILYKLVEFPFAPKLSQGSDIRQQKLRNIIERLSKYGIKLYIYLNEPRGLPIELFEGFEHLCGEKNGNLGTFCTSQPEVKEYIEDGICRLFTSLQGLGGIISITMSENLTNCQSRAGKAGTECKACAARENFEVVSEVNNLIYRGIKRAGSDGALLAWTWGWNDTYGFSRGQINKAVELLDQGIEVVCNSDDVLDIEICGTKNKVYDYSISQSGSAPSARTRETFAACDTAGRKKVAKIQLNNSWECCAAPFIPAFSINRAHMQNLAQVGTDGIILCWSLGGYPSPNLDYIKGFYFDNPQTPEQWFYAFYGEDAQAAQNASQRFSSAFEKFPFTVNMLYYSPVNAGAVSLFGNPPIRGASMLGFSYDDVDRWSHPYNSRCVMDVMGGIVEGTKAAIHCLDDCKTPSAIHLRRQMRTVYSNYLSVYLHMQYVLGTDTQRQQAVKLEKQNVCTILQEHLCDSTLGYEASNHYFFNVNALLEKIVSLSKLKERSFLG